jgi:hypothetical protein
MIHREIEGLSEKGIQNMSKIGVHIHMVMPAKIHVIFPHHESQYQRECM